MTKQEFDSLQVDWEIITIDLIPNDDSIIIRLTEKIINTGWKGIVVKCADKSKVDTEYAPIVIPELYNIYSHGETYKKYKKLRGLYGDV